MTVKLRDDDRLRSKEGLYLLHLSLAQRGHPRLGGGTYHRVEMNEVRLDPLNRCLHLQELTLSIVDPFAKQDFQPDLASVNLSEFHHPVDHLLDVELFMRPVDFL